MILPAGYAIGVLIAVFSTVLLIRSYREHRTPLLLWCSLCFAGLAINNLLLFIDLFVAPSASLQLWRNVVALLALSSLLLGLIWEDA
ncbi:MAG: hypothetical protein K0R38_423 [Polyangiaceae bacterium]|jgi:hypothetical protein|nr:hypothetical protein [Polyangiaceae bacterium]